ncbi:hypothetical protein F5877DRAFT_73408, partial [Lentinula edodes]
SVLSLQYAQQDNQQRADSINEPLNDVDSSIKYFMDANSPVDQFEKNEKTYAKQENERLHRELQDLNICRTNFHNQTFDNLSSQLQELADRCLENIPVGLGPILDLIKTSQIVNDKSPSKKQSHS